MPERTKEETALFEKVGECLHRYQLSGVYYARIKTGGKDIRRSLTTKDKHIAKSNLAELRKELGQVDLSEGRISLAEWCDRYLRSARRAGTRLSPPSHPQRPLGYLRHRFP